MMDACKSRAVHGLPSAQMQLSVNGLRRPTKHTEPTLQIPQVKVVYLYFKLDSRTGKSTRLWQSILGLQWKICEPSSKGLYQRRIAEMKLAFDDSSIYKRVVVS